MEISRQTQTIIALISGVALGALLVFLFMQHYYENRQQVNTAQTQQTRSVAEQTTESQLTPDATPIAQKTQTQATQPETSQPTTQTQDSSATVSETLAAQTVAQTSQSYTYTARTGDSYSVLARKAVQTYGLQHKITLSQAQIVAAESNLAIQAGSPELNEGQQVSITTSSVKSVVETAQKMNADETAAWQAYVYDVDFSTSDNG